MQLLERFGVRIACRRFFTRMPPRDLLAVIKYILTCTGVQLTRQCETAYVPDCC